MAPTKTIDLTYHEKTRVRIGAYLTLCKYKVVVLMQLTAGVGMVLSPLQPENPIKTAIIALIGIGLASAAGACCNHILDQNFDVIMKRTEKRPLPQGTVSTKEALILGLILFISSMLIMYYWVNPLACALTLAATIGYALIYTVLLKHLTPQNIVIGGLSGALPPLLGWASMAGTLSYQPWLLVLIVFVWTPPHFWALAIHRYQDYQKANIPMLPVTHGIDYTKQHILLYSILLFVVTLLPFSAHMFGAFYLLTSCILNGFFLYYAWQLKHNEQPGDAKKLFLFSIHYLGILFAAMLIDACLI